MAVLIAALLLVVLGAYVCLRVALAGSRALGLDAEETLIWFGLAELPDAPSPRPVRPARRSRTASSRAHAH